MTEDRHPKKKATPICHHVCDETNVESFLVYKKTTTKKLLNGMCGNVKSTAEKGV
jgi:hypothetical protein